jgi:mono/diheme cytochrome c family protein
MRRRVVVQLAAAAVVLLLAVAWASLVGGWYDVSASVPASSLERRLAHFLADHAVARRAPKGPNPLQVTPEVLRRGLLLYRDNCVVCHGVPGEPQSNIAAGLNPPPPDLADEDSQDGPDGELFQVISNGLRMTGMPAFSKSQSKDTLWTLVAFVRHLPKLTDEERLELRPRGDKPDGH